MVISGVSDHEAVMVESKLFIKHKQLGKREIKLWNKADINKIKSEASNFNNLFKNIHQNLDVNDMWLCIKK